jgi:hypothetical protein
MRNKLIALFLFSFTGLLFLISPVFAVEEEEINIHFFEDRLCTTCKAQKEFMESIKSNYPQLEINIYSITETEKLKELANYYEVENYKIMAPTSFVNGVFFQFTDFTERQEKMVIDAIEGKYIEEKENIIKIPFINKEVDISKFSLLTTAIILSSVDGFNICSMGALILILSIVLVFDSRRKIIGYGSLFILTTAVVYGTIVFAWGKLFELLLSHLAISRIIIGLMALIGGIYFFKEFLKFLKHGPTCDFANSKILKGPIDKIKNSFASPKKSAFFLAGGVILFSAIIVIVELPCSIGIPIVFGGILAENNLPIESYLFYILVYLFFYMLIEVIIFLIAVFTKKIWLSNSNIVTWVTLIGSIFMFYLAFYYLF